MTQSCVQLSGSLINTSTRHDLTALEARQDTPAICHRFVRVGKERTASSGAHVLAGGRVDVKLMS